VTHGSGEAGIPECLANVPIFRALPGDCLSEIGRGIRHRKYERGEVVALSGDAVDHLVVVDDGRLKLSHSTVGGREQVVRTLEAGEFLGELALFAPARYEGDVVALTDCDVCLVPRQVFTTILRRHPEVSGRLLEVLAERLTRAEQTIADLGLRDVGQRLAADLLRRVGRDQPAAGEITVDVPIPWSEVALQLGTTPESLSRRLHALEEQGIVRQVGPRTLVIRSLDGLREAAGS
jgi:CRP/FNR family transcriptional regulator, anaerobic regulatory protein